VQKRKKSKSKGIIKERKEKVLSAMRDLGGQVYGQLNKKEFPTFRMPSRSIANILYDSKTRQYILGKTLGTSARSRNSSGRPCSQTNSRNRTRPAR